MQRKNLRTRHQCKQALRSMFKIKECHGSNVIRNNPYSNPITRFDLTYHGKRWNSRHRRAWLDIYEGSEELIVECIKTYMTIVKGGNADVYIRANPKFHSSKISKTCSHEEQIVWELFRKMRGLS